MFLIFNFKNVSNSDIEDLDPDENSIVSSENESLHAIYTLLPFIHNPLVYSVNMVI